MSIDSVYLSLIDATAILFRLADSLCSGLISLFGNVLDGLKDIPEKILTGFFITEAKWANQQRVLRIGRRMPLVISIQSTATPTTITGDLSHSTQQFMLAALARRPMSGSWMMSYTWYIEDML